MMSSQPHSLPQPKPPTVPGALYTRAVQPLPKLGTWTAALDKLLMENALKPARERLTLIRIFEALRELGYDGGYDAVRRYARRWRSRQGSGSVAAYVPLSFAPGEAYQFDWSQETVVLNGATTVVKVAHLRLCHSRMLFVRAYPRESQEMVFDAHDRGFAFFRGACVRGIYDNMKTAVDAVFVGKERRCWPRTSASSTSPARRSTKVWSAIWPPAPSWPSNAMPCWLAEPVRARAIWRLPSRAVASEAVPAPGSSRSSIWSTGSRPRPGPADTGEPPSISSGSIWSFWTSWVTCRSPNREGSCCST